MKFEKHGKILIIAVASCEGVPERWRSQYPPEKYADDTRWGQVSAKIDRIDPKTITPDELAAIIGNKSWTHPRCSVHGEFVDRVLLVDDNSDICICAECMRDGLAAIAKDQPS